MRSIINACKKMSVIKPTFFNAVSVQNTLLDIMYEPNLEINGRKVSYTSKYKIAIVEIDSNVKNKDDRRSVILINYTQSEVEERLKTIDLVGRNTDEHKIDIVVSNKYQLREALNDAEMIKSIIRIRKFLSLSGHAYLCSVRPLSTINSLCYMGVKK